MEIEYKLTMLDKYKIQDGEKISWKYRIQIGHVRQIQNPIGILHVGNVDKNSDREYLLQVQEADIDGDQHVSFEEFRDIFNEG